MSVVRKIVVPVTTLFLGLFLAAGTATAASTYDNGCDDTDWHTVCR